METRTETIRNEHGCCEVGIIIHEGREFSAGGACVYENPQTGKLEGVLYADDSNVHQGPGNTRTRETVLTSWDGKIKVPATIASTWEGNFRDYHGRPQVNRSYYFTIKGRKCRGVNYNREWSQIVRFKEMF